MPDREAIPAEVLSQQLMRLLAGMSGHGARQLDGIETDLAQMSILLDEAIRKLGASFLAIHAALGRQQAVLAALRDGKVSAAECAPVFEGIQGEIELHINAAVTGLQFEDMTSQLIRGMGRHLAELRGVFGAIQPVNAQVPDGAGCGETLVLLDCANRRLAELGPGGADGVQKPVAQRHMESGEIELFDACQLPPAAGCGA